MARTDDNVHVICLEGEHGVGKSELFTALHTHPRIGEDFIGVPSVEQFHKQDPVCQIDWVKHWFTNLRAVLRPYWNPTSGRYIDLRSDGRAIVSDRSPYSAAVYARREKDVVLSTVKMYVREHERLGVRFDVVCLRRDRDDVWSDVLSRLEAEPGREEFDEGSREHFDKTCLIYDTWDVFANKRHIATAAGFARYLTE